MDSLYESLRWRYPSFTRGLSGQSSLLRIISSFKNEARKIGKLIYYIPIPQQGSLQIIILDRRIKIFLIQV